MQSHDVMPTAAHKENGGAADEINLLSIWRVLRRRKALIFGTTLVLTAILAATIFVLTPKFSATAYVMIDPGQTEIVEAIEAAAAGSSADAATVESEVRVLQSRALADRVAADLQLDNDPEFNASLRPPGLLDPYLDPLEESASGAVATVKRWLAPVIAGTDQAAANNADPAQAQRIRSINKLLSRLDVTVDGRSRVIAVAFTSERPQTATKVVNTLADLYIITKLEAKFDAAKTANRWLNDRAAELRTQVAESEAAVERYRAENGLIQNKDVMITTQEATDIGAQLALARSQRTEAEARLHKVKNALGKPDGVAALLEVMESALILRLREQETEVQRKVSDLGQRLGPKHPFSLSARAELAQIQQKIAVEGRKLVEGLKNEAVAARARESLLTDELQSLKGEAGAQSQSEVKLRALDREAAASRTLLETFLQRAQEMSSQESFQQADAHIVSKAAVPSTPTFPKRNFMIAAAVATALTIAVMLAFLLEMMDQSFRSEEQAEKALGVATLGLVPSLKRSWGKSKRASSYIADHPVSAYAESMRHLYTGLRLSNGELFPRTVLIASSLPNEGKTTVAASLASLLSATGLKTIVIDADLRKPTLHVALAMPAGPGLADYLRQRAPLESVIRHDQATGIDAITAGGPVANAPELLGAERMKALLARLQDTYDTVILDTAPILAVSDARILARMVEKIVFLVRWAETRRGVALRGLQQIADAPDKLAGIMLTRVDFEKYAKYRCGEFGHYYRRIEQYYAA